jgi:Flp pilus assembly protein TadG
MSIYRRLHLCLLQNRAVASLEFALLLPLIISLFYGTIEAARLMLVHQKLTKTTFTIADILTQGTTVCDENLTQFYVAATEVLKPFSATDATFGYTATSAASGTGLTLPDPPCTAGTDCITWQRTKGYGSSLMGAVGSRPNLAANTISAGQNVIIIETFYVYTPMLDAAATIVPMFAARTIYNVAVFKPRAGDMVTYDVNCPS